MKKLLLLGCVLLSGCSGVGPKYNPSMIAKPAPGAAKVVIFYPNSVNGIRPMSVTVDDQRCFLYSNGFTVTDVTPGKTFIDVNGDSVQLNTTRSKTSYVKVTQNQGKSQAAGMFGLAGLAVYSATHNARDNASLIFDVVEADSARSQLQGLQLSPGCE